MLRSLTRNRPGILGSLPRVSLLGGVGLLLGAACLFVSPLWTLVGLLVLGLLLLALKRPEVLALVYLLLTSTVTRVTRALSVSLGFGTFYLTDALLLLAFGIIVTRVLAERKFQTRRTPLDWALLLFVGASLLSTIVAVRTGSLPWRQSLGEVRIVLGYLLFFVVTNLVRGEHQLRNLVRGLIALAAAVAVATIVQYAVGQSDVLLAGRIEELATEGTEIVGVARVIPPGQSLLVVGFTLVLATLVLDTSGFLDVARVFLLGLLGTAIVITFFRASWVVVALTTIAVIASAGRRDKQRLILWAIIAVMVLGIVGGLTALKPESQARALVQAALERLQTLAEPATYESPSSSLRWRDFEYSYAIPEIMSSPFIGLGLGARYRPFVPPRDYEGFDGRDFIHNGHVWVVLKAGLFAYIGLMYFSLGIVFRGLRRWRRMREAWMRGLVLGSALVFMGALIVSNIEPYVMTASWTPVLAVVAGINEVALRIDGEQTSRLRTTDFHER
jgi:hypothetical protein